MTPNVLDIYVDQMAHTEVVGQSLRIRTGLADVFLRFPAAMPALERAKFLAQLAATATREEKRIVAATPDADPTASREAVVPRQRAGGRS